MSISPKNAVFLLLLAGAASTLLWFAPRGSTPTDSKPTVAATIFPLYDIVRNIAGETINVTLILPPGAEPHSFEPAPSTIREVSASAAVYTIGYGIDDWINPVIASTAADKVTVDRGILLREFKEPIALGDTAEEEHGVTDPHYWLTVPNAKVIAETITDDLSARFPEQEAQFRANFAVYSESLTALEMELRAIIPAGKRIVTFHDAWYYFADAYGLNIVGAFEPAPGREPTPRALTALREAIRKAGATIIYAEPLFSDDAIESFAQDAAIRIGTLDDIGGTTGTESYIKLMLSNAESIAEKK